MSTSICSHRLCFTFLCANIRILFADVMKFQDSKRFDDMLNVNDNDNHMFPLYSLINIVREKKMFAPPSAACFMVAVSVLRSYYINVWQELCEHLQVLHVHNILH